MLPEQDTLFGSLYQKHYDKLHIYAYRQLGDPFKADEAVQDTFCTALQKQEEFLACEKPMRYLMAVLKYKIREQRRAQSRYLKVFLAVDQNFLLEAGASPPVPDCTDYIIDTARDALNDEEWRIFQKFILSGFTHLEIAKELGISVSASQKRLERIREKLEDLLP